MSAYHSRAAAWVGLLVGLTAALAVPACNRTKDVGEDESIVDLDQVEGKTFYDRVKRKAEELYARAVKEAGDGGSDLAEIDDLKAKADKAAAAEKKIKAVRLYDRLISLCHDILYPLPED